MHAIYVYFEIMSTISTATVAIVLLFESGMGLRMFPMADIAFCCFIY